MWGRGEIDDGGKDKMKNLSKPKWINFSDVTSNLPTCPWFWCWPFLVIKVGVFKEKQCLWLLQPLGKCHCEGKLFFICLVNFSTDEKSILHQFFFQVLFVWYVSSATWKQQFKHYFNEKNCPWLAWYPLKWICSWHLTDKMFAWNIFWRTKPLFVATFSKVHREISLNYSFGCQNIANPPFLRKKDKHYQSLKAILSWIKMLKLVD